MRKSSSKNPHPHMTDQERLLKSYHRSDLAWAKQAVDQTLETLLFNELLVNKGLWGQYISQMTTEDEFDVYAAFVVGLKALYSRADKSSL